VATQLERSSATREKTIAATIACLVERGFHGVTITAVAERAGVSRGAVSHQYPDKTLLVVDVVDEIRRRRLDEVHAVLNAVPPGRRRIEVGLDEMWRVFKDPIYLAALEVYVGARTDPQLHPRVLKLEFDVDEAIRELVRTMTGPTSDAGQADLRADVVINTLRGLALLHATGAPLEPLERIWALARADTLESLTALAAGAGIERGIGSAGIPSGPVQTDTALGGH
jgi:AcrR family transcriptional regulator